MSNKTASAADAKNWVAWLHTQYNCSGCDLAHFSLYLLAGLMSGLLFKAYGRPLLFLLCTTGLILFFLQYTHIITIQFPAITTYLGLPKASSLDDIFIFYGQWAKDHVLFCLIAFFGFLIGWRLG